jgi:2-dehydro-3-deoxyphosphogluconate aldolase/(4S)-4-hydroxy-2-oxoglutarate aldolase
MKSIFPDSLADRIRAAKIVAVVVIDEPSDAVPLGRALLAGGIDTIELTLRTPTAFHSLAAIRRECPEMLAGVGTVLTPDQVRSATNVSAGPATRRSLSARPCFTTTSAISSANGCRICATASEPTAPIPTWHPMSSANTARSISATRPGPTPA